MTERGDISSPVPQSQPASTARPATDNFFQLRDEAAAHKWETNDEFWDAVVASPEISNALYWPNALKKKVRFRSIDERSFKNVSFSKTEVSEVSFKKCRFEECLFIDTDFKDCEFHNCYFLNCNTFKASFTNCYLDPLSFRDSFRLNPSEYSNISMWLYKTLIVNSTAKGQHQFRASAEYLFKQCERHNLWKKKRHREVAAQRFWTQLILSHLHNAITGYGWKPLRLVGSMCAVTAGLVLVNKAMWNWYGVADSQTTLLEPSLWDALAYTLSMLTTLGFGRLVPTTTVGMLAAAIQAVLGVIFFAFIASIALRYVVKSAE